MSRMHVVLWIEYWSEGEDQQIYNATYNNEMTNLSLIREVTNIMGLDFDSSIQFVQDRPGHDFRYSIDNTHLLHLNITAPTDFRAALKTTIESWSDE